MSDHHQHTVSYPDAIEQYRADKDAYFRTGAGSPIPAADRAAFAGLPYFPVDERLIVDGITLEPYLGGEPARFEIPTTDGRLRPAERAGVFRFRLLDADCSLVAYRMAGSDGTVHDSLFLPFLDGTTGRESYGAGRYLDLEAEDDGTWTIDFNVAYHPSCVYDPRFSCPLTPPENRLPIRIEAGERLAAGADGH
jgi:uncharacterized protein (DUF1684 family)